MTPHKIYFFGYSINMANPQQRKIQNEIGQIKTEINLLQDRLKKNEKSKNQFQKALMRVKKIRVKKKTKQTKAGFFSNQKNAKYSEEYTAKKNRANQEEYKFTTK